LTLTAVLLAICGCTQGPPFGDDHPVAHHDPFPAPNEREARFVQARAYGSQPDCEERLGEIGPVVHLSAYEAVAHRTVPHEGGEAIEEHLCAREILRVRAWYSGTAPAPAHH